VKPKPEVLGLRAGQLPLHCLRESCTACAPLVRHLCANTSAAVSQPLAAPSTCPSSSVPAVPGPRRGVHRQYAVLRGSGLLLLHRRQVQPIGAAACGAGRARLQSSRRGGVTHAALSNPACTRPPSSPEPAGSPATVSAHIPMHPPRAGAVQCHAIPAECCPAS
jgi:hypothetical protein